MVGWVLLSPIHFSRNALLFAIYLSHPQYSRSTWLFPTQLFGRNLEQRLLAWPNAAILKMVTSAV